MIFTMPRKSRSKLPPLNLGKETVGQRIARLRKERGFTQIELAERMGIVQGLISDYERNKLRPHPEMLSRFALALETTSDDILGLQVKDKAGSNGHKPSLRILRRLNRIGALPQSQQKVLLKTIDTFLKGAEK